jgi:hypothetical protein
MNFIGCNGCAQGRKDWCDLPDDLIHLITKNLSDLQEFVCFQKNPYNPYQRIQVVQEDSCHYLPSNDSSKGVICLFNLLTKEEHVLHPIPHPHLMASPWMIWTGTNPIIDHGVLVVNHDIYRCNYHRGQ